METLCHDAAIRSRRPLQGGRSYDPEPRPILATIDSAHCFVGGELVASVRPRSVRRLGRGLRHLLGGELLPDTPLPAAPFALPRTAAGHPREMRLSPAHLQSLRATRLGLL